MFGIVLQLFLEFRYGIVKFVCCQMKPAECVVEIGIGGILRGKQRINLLRRSKILLGRQAFGEADAVHDVAAGRILVREMQRQNAERSHTHAGGQFVGADAVSHQLAETRFGVRKVTGAELDATELIEDDAAKLGVFQNA